MNACPELLAPAGNMRCLKTAIRFGADAVYLGAKRYSLRTKSANFDSSSLSEAVICAHKAGVRVYLALNAFPREGEIPKMADIAKEAYLAGIDAAIVSDIGLAAALQRSIPELTIHVSTQANITNSAAAAVWISVGARRIVLSRELSLGQIRSICRELRGEAEFEAFIHGSMCMAWSGRCFLSAYLSGRSANGGSCTQPCRWAYRVSEAKNGQNQLFVTEDTEETEIFSAQDLCMIDHLDELADAGISSFKIEGRTKSEFYVGTTVFAYRSRMDRIFKGKENATETEALQYVNHRPYSTGFYYGIPDKSSSGLKVNPPREYVGYVNDVKDGYALVEMRNRFCVGDGLEAVTPGRIMPVRVCGILSEDLSITLDTVTVPMQKTWVRLTEALAPGDMLCGPLRNRK